ncbi:uncharacterized protein At1g08160-like [Cornus florida]|uniref:uncharacterized protein At1g08160-like n=1 Tax=Cornus florida TaxID=4283 RepID=UPI002896326A|nr:uncharacterized protein At1g08160-like [Cornus florida]
MPNPPQPRASRPAHSKLLRLIAIVLLALVVLVGVAVLTIWLVVKPRRLVYTIEDGSIHGYSLSKNNHLNATFKFVLRAYNPNSKVSIYYDKIEAKVYYDDENVAYNTVDPFFQPHRNVTRLEVKLAAEDVSLFRPVARDLELEKSSGGVELEVRFKARIRFKLGKWKSRHRTLRIYCAPVLVHFSSSKLFERTFCNVDM